MSLSPSVDNTRAFLNEINNALYVNKLVSLRSSSLFSLLVHSAAYAHHLFTFSPFNDCLARFLSYTLRKCNEGTSFFLAFRRRRGRERNLFSPLVTIRSFNRGANFASIFRRICVSRGIAKSQRINVFYKSNSKYI